jgi:hypothetical protein
MGFDLSNGRGQLPPCWPSACDDDRTSKARATGAASRIAAGSVDGACITAPAPAPGWYIAQPGKAVSLAQASGEGQPHERLLRGVVRLWIVILEVVSFSK